MWRFKGPACGASPPGGDADGRLPLTGGLGAATAGDCIAARGAARPGRKGGGAELGCAALGL